MSILLIIMGIIVILVAVVTILILNSEMRIGFYGLRNYIFTIIVCIFGIFFIVLGISIL